MSGLGLVLLVAAVAACGGGRKTATAPATAFATAPGASTGTSTPGAKPTATADLQNSFVGVVGRVTPEVVQISSPQGLGSGVVFDSSSDVVTNAHVVAGGGPFRVTDSSGRTYPANVVGTFAANDLAVVHARGASLPKASFGDSRQLHVGDIVLAIGNPLGLRSSVTNGIVSALGRTVSEPNGVVLPNVIQTSADINPGNSGGALVDLNGQVIGIPTLAATDPELGGSAAPGIGFAVPSAVVTDIASQLISHGRVTNSHRAFLGVVLASGAATGAIVVSVQAGGPAARAGIVPGDVIVSIDGQPVMSASDVAALLATLSPGQTVKVGITKSNGQATSVTVKLGQYAGQG